LQRARAVAEGIDGVLLEIRSAFLERLTGMPPGDLPRALEDWRSASPLVRNVFIVSDDGRVLLPHIGPGATEEEEGFIRRFKTLFAGEAAWSQGAGEGAQTGDAETARSPRRELRALALARPEERFAAEAPARPGRRGWLPWYADDRLTLLAWVELPEEGIRYGAEVEMMALAAHLFPVFPTSLPAGLSFALVDGGGRAFYQTGATSILQLDQIALTPAGPRLPHWQVAVYGSPEALAGLGKDTHLVWLLLAGTFVAAIVFGGSLLLWQARRNALDARRKTTFVSNVSHELKTPLTTIRMYADLLVEGVVRDREKREHYLRVIGSESARLARLVNNMLDFSRLEQGRKTYRREEVSLKDLIEEQLETLHMRFGDVGMDVERRFDAGDCVVFSDRDALEQIFLNIIDNGVKYASSGGVLRIEFVKTADGFLVRFRDRGPGIAPEHRQKVFESFHRIDKSLTTKQPGTGLGLSIARQLARDLGGDIVLETAERDGACFTVTVPRGGPA